MRDRLGIPAPKPGAEVVGGRPASVSPAPEDSPPKSAIQKPEVAQSLNMSQLFASAHARGQGDEIMDRLVDRLGEETAGAMAGLIETVRKELMAATDLRDAAERIARLNLPPDDLAEAMARGMVLAHLAGQAALIDDLAGRS
jgi:hypothetical protein